MTLTLAASLEALALDAARNLEHSSAEEIVRWASDTFGDRFAITASMSDGVLSHVAGRAAPGDHRAVPRHRLPLRGDHRDP